MLLRLVLLFQPESHSDGTRPRHTPGLTALDHSAGRKSCQRSPGQVRSPQPTPYHALTASSQVTRSGQDGSDRSIRTTGHGQPRQNHTAMGPDHGTLLASLPSTTQLEGRAANTLQDSQTHTAMGPDHGTLLASPKGLVSWKEELPTLYRTVTAPSGRRDTDSRPLHQDDGTRTASPESHSDGTRPRHNPGLSPLQNSAGKPANTLQDRTTGHGQPRQNHTAMGPDHGTLLASLPSTTQLEGRAANALQDR
ncbi:uncharacterized protein LOC121070861 isoform X7 [Cygnus olor]|uniref:uncharacterized protein LOC121070861 isoform X7 n=1 Tax=Cygnus olor TaxID=8869 RepID=UPI001ADE1ED8|nr:uncharacterized protein LOC121070861 isoform X7 [Cygnus olor]